MAKRLEAPFLPCTGSSLELMPSVSSERARAVHSQPVAEPADEVNASEPPRSGPRNHAVQFYEDEGHLLETVAGFVTAGLEAGDPVLVIATKVHEAAFRAFLETRCFEVERAVELGDLVFVDATATLEMIVRDGEPACDLFMAHIGGIVREVRARKNERPLRAYGEMVDVLWKTGNTRAAIRLEELWNELAKTEHVLLLCG